jgi:hypothetical protein
MWIGMGGEGVGCGGRLTDFFDRIMDDRIMLPESNFRVYGRIMDGKIILLGRMNRGVGVLGWG